MYTHVIFSLLSILILKLLIKPVSCASTLIQNPCKDANSLYEFASLQSLRLMLCDRLRVPRLITPELFFALGATEPRPFVYLLVIPITDNEYPPTPGVATLYAQSNPFCVAQLDQLFLRHDGWLDCAEIQPLTVVSPPHALYAAKLVTTARWLELLSAYPATPAIQIPHRHVDRHTITCFLLWFLLLALYRRADRLSAPTIIPLLRVGNGFTAAVHGLKQRQVILKV